MKKMFRIGIKRDAGTVYTNFELETEERRGILLVYGLDEAVLERFPSANDWSFMTPSIRDTTREFEDGSTTAIYELR